jgi:DNA helicase-2/ATP-dependent DNA helicase PcrA
MAYLRLIQNFSDEVSLERIINEPKRAIGSVTLSNWLALSKKQSLDPIETGLKIQNFKLDIDSKFKIQNSKFDPITKFSEFIQRMSEVKNKLRLTDFIQKVYSESGYEKYIMDGTEEGEMKNENVRELLTIAKEYDQYENDEGLPLFLEKVALNSDTDNIDQKSEAVHLMTLHSAKGLEFKIVFIAGLEEGILPHGRSMLDSNEMEEERRLMYVGITRAMEKVYLLFTTERNIFGSTQVNAPSRFLDDIPEHLVKKHEERSGKKEEEIQKTNHNSKFIPHNSSFKDGDRIQHEIFGDGMIVATQGDIITVAFKTAGLKKLSASIAPLKKL